MAMQNYLALDLGASGGRAIVGRFDGERLTLEEVHRFANGPVALPTAYGASLYWDAARLYSEVMEGVGKAAMACADATGHGLVSAGLDTWGVDFALLDRAGVLLGNPYHYRDSRTDGMLEEAFRRVSREEIFAATGLQFMQINSLYQLLAMVLRDDPALKAAKTLLFIPDLLNYWLTGQKVSERSIASTSQCLDPFTGDWARSLIDRMGIPAEIFPEIVAPGTVLGELLPHIAAETGAGSLTIVAPGCHDTASAVAAVPAKSDDYAYLSSGTWSLMGIESSRPVVNDQSLAFNVTNESGVCDTIRLLKNITGLWVIQECRRAWIQESGPLSWDQIVGMAALAPAFTAFIDVDAREFATPGNMPARICAYCEATGQPVPQDRGTVARVVFESLALKYRHTLEVLDQLAVRRHAVLHIVGGGTQNRLLSQFAANATGRPVVAGPIEATAAGNALVQMLATGAISSLAEGRAIISNSFDTEEFEPQDTAAWDEAYARFG